MKWFKHDSAAHRDIKIKRLKRKYGIVGYGLYWYCLELIAGHVEKSNATFELEDDAEEIAHEWSLDRVTVSEIMAYMVELELFECNDYRITCLKMATRLDDTNSRHPAIQEVVAQIRSQRCAKKPIFTSGKSEHGTEKSEDTRRLSEQTRLDKTRLELKDTSGTKKDSQRKSLPRPYSEMVCRVHSEILPELESVRMWDNKQKRAQHLLKIYQNKDVDTSTEDFWKTYFEHVRGVDWWMGRVQPQSGQPFRASFEFLVHPDRFCKIVEACLNSDKKRRVAN